MDRQRVEKHPLLLGLPDAELDLVAQVAGEREFSAGEAVVTEGDFGHGLFLVEDGTAEVTIGGTRVGSVGPGDIIGEIAVLASGRRNATIVATSPMRTMTLFKRDVWEIERDAPETGRRFRAAIQAHRGEDAGHAPATS